MKCQKCDKEKETKEFVSHATIVQWCYNCRLECPLEYKNWKNHNNIKVTIEHLRIIEIRKKVEAFEYLYNRKPLAFIKSKGLRIRYSKMEKEELPDVWYEVEANTLRRISLIINVNGYRVQVSTRNHMIDKLILL